MLSLRGLRIQKIPDIAYSFVRCTVDNIVTLIRDKGGGRQSRLKQPQESDNALLSHFSNRGRGCLNIL